MNMSHPIHTSVCGLIIVLTVGLSVLTSPLQARIQLDIIAKFRNAGVELDVVTVVDSGSMTETETSDVSHLTISAGPGVKFVISSSQKGIVTFVLSKDDIGGFEKALYQVKEFFSR